MKDETMKKYVMRAMELSDIPGVLAVEEASFPSPWTADIFEYEVSENPNSAYFVLEIEQKIVGYLGSWIILDECQITNVAIHPSRRGQHLGDVLIKEFLGYCQLRGVAQISLEVRVTNAVAQNLYRKYEFKDGGIRKGYYVEEKEDALVMWRKL